MHELYLQQSCVMGPDDQFSGLNIEIHNLTNTDFVLDRLCYTSVARINEDTRVMGGIVLRRQSSYAEISPHEKRLCAGDALCLQILGLPNAPFNRVRGIMSAWIHTIDGNVVECEISDLAAPAGVGRSAHMVWPEGHLNEPVCLLPWPEVFSVKNGMPAKRYRPGCKQSQAVFANVAALHRRLFPTAPSPFAFGDGPDIISVNAQLDKALPEEGYALEFGECVELRYADSVGLQHAVISLAQMAHAAATDSKFSCPADGRIEDAPRFGWRGLHLDVARNFFGMSTILRLLDIMAWMKMNRFHWHLTDDEAWRIPSRAFPELNTVGTVRGEAMPILPQYGDGPTGQSGSYGETGISQIVARARMNGIDVIPELDMPSHCTALLHAIPELRDPDEPENSYYSIQSYPNNALNPGMDRTFDIVETLLRETADLFPGPIIHTGGDEVAADSWAESPAAAKVTGLKSQGATQLQAYFTQRVHEIVTRLGKTMAVWDECADGGESCPKDALLVVWQSREKVVQLVSEGFDVIASPGQAYYLDMGQGSGWDSFGHGWGGNVTALDTYRYDPGADLPDGPGKLLGVQACVWTTHFRQEAELNHALFPRLSAVAEAAWTPVSSKDENRFMYLSHLMPSL